MNKWFACKIFIDGIGFIFDKNPIFVAELNNIYLTTLPEHWLPKPRVAGTLSTLISFFCASK